MINQPLTSSHHSLQHAPHRAFYRAVSKQRWSVTQKRELNFWKKIGALAARQEFSKRYYLTRLKSLFIENTSEISVLEIGSGPVCVTQYLDAKYHTYIDPLFDDYRRLFPGILPEDSVYKTTMAEVITLPASSFDAVVCLNTLSDVHNPELVLNQAKHLLKPDGKFIVSIDAWPSLLARTHLFLSRFAPSLPRINRLYSYTLKGFSNSLARHFKIVSASPVQDGFNWFSLKQEYFFVCEHLEHNKNKGK